MLSIKDTYVNKMTWISGYEYYLEITDLIPPTSMLNQLSYTQNDDENYG
jgi:hypothetical protein